MIINKKLNPGFYFLKGRAFKKFFIIENLSPHWSNSIRMWIRRRVYYKTLSLKEEDRSLILALLLNEKLNKKWKIIYKLGLGHYFAISGLHINIIATTFLAIFSSLIANIILWFFILIYLLTIRSPSMFRAFLFFSFTLLSRIFKEEKSRRKEFILSLALSIAIFGIDNISLQLSFIASYTLLMSKSKNIVANQIKLSTFLATPSLFFFKEVNILSIIINLIIQLPMQSLIIISFLNLILPIETLLKANIFIIEKIIGIKFLYLPLKIEIGKPILCTYYLLLLIFFLFENRVRNIFSRFYYSVYCYVHKIAVAYYMFCHLAAYIYIYLILIFLFSSP